MSSTTKPEIKMGPPYEVAFSEKVKAKYGYKDGHVELEVDLPFPLCTVKKTYNEKFTASEVTKLKATIRENCPAVDSPEFREDAPGHQTCPR